MRCLTILLLFLPLAACAPGMSPVPDSEEEIMRETALLIDASLAGRLMENTEAFYRDQVGTMLQSDGIPPQQAAAIVDAALQPLLETERRRLVEALVPIYRRFYTAAEIHQLLSFYQTEVARKSMRVSPQIAADSREYVQLWSEHFSSSLLQRVDADLQGRKGQQ